MFGTEIPLRLVLIVLTILCLTGMGGAILGLTGPIIAVLALTRALPPSVRWHSGAVICKYFGEATGSAKINLSKREASAQL